MNRWSGRNQTDRTSKEILSRRLDNIDYPSLVTEDQTPLVTREEQIRTILNQNHSNEELLESKQRGLLRSTLGHWRIRAQ